MVFLSLREITFSQDLENERSQHLEFILNMARGRIERAHYVVCSFRCHSCNCPLIGFISDPLPIFLACTHMLGPEYAPVVFGPFDLKAGFARGCRKAGISGVTWHTLRHTFASRLVNRGVDIVTVKELLGHSNLSVTMRYAHTNLDNKRAAVEKLDGFGDNLVTVSANVHQSRAALSPNRTLRYNVASS